MIFVLHVLSEAKQNKPVEEVHVFVPQRHGSELVEVPLILEQAEMAECKHSDLCTSSCFLCCTQNKPVVAVQGETPQMHPALLAVVPSVSEQNGPLAQMQFCATLRALCVVLWAHFDDSLQFQFDPIPQGTSRQDFEYLL